MAEYVNPETGEVFDKAHPEFVDVLLKMSDGASHGELTDNLRELAKAAGDVDLRVEGEAGERVRDCCRCPG